jgi:hypothetical protein
MKLLIIILLSMTMISCQIHYIKTIPAPEAQPVVIYPADPCPLPITGSPHPIGPIKPQPPVKTEPLKIPQDNHNKRPQQPKIQRPERPVTIPSTGVKKEKKTYTR